MTRKRLLIILGAGSSVDMHMPSVDCIGTLMKSWSAERSRASQEPDYFGYISTRLREHYSSIKKAISTPTLNFERVLGEMTSLANWVRPAPFSTAMRTVIGCRNLPPELTFRNYTEESAFLAVVDNVKYLMERLATNMREKCRGIDLSSDTVRRCRRLYDGLRTAFDVGIINLNYDTVALNACPGIFTGYAADSQFDAKRLHGNEWNFLYHLHGSVHNSLTDFGEELEWVNDSAAAGDFRDSPRGLPRRDVSDNKALPRTSLVAGGFKLDQLLVEPFQSMYAAMVRSIHNADAILIGGYGFGDVHVNEALSNRLRDQSSRSPVVVLDKSPPDHEIMDSRRDAWSRNLCKVLNAVAHDFSEPRQERPPHIQNLLNNKIFEVNSSQQVVIWHGGFTSAADRIDEIVNWMIRSNYTGS